MLGDLVRYTNPPYIRVASITKKKIGYHLRPDEPRMHYVRLCEVNPIPITPEILEKNGFELHEGETGLYGVTTAPYYALDGAPYIFCDGNPYAAWFEDQVDIKYVHQLQHILRLCGIKNEIQL